MTCNIRLLEFWAQCALQMIGSLSDNRGVSRGLVRGEYISITRFANKHCGGCPTASVPLVSHPALPRYSARVRPPPEHPDRGAACGLRCGP